MIGIYGRYRKTDSTLAALSVVRYLDDAGRQFLFNNIDWRVWRSGDVDPNYDNKITNKGFLEGLNSIKQLVITNTVDEYFIDQATRRKIKTILYTSWDQLEPIDEKAIGAYTYVLTPSLIQAVQLREHFHLHNVAVLPYDTGLPITIKTANTQPDQIRLFISLYGTQLNRISSAAAIILRDIVHDMSHVYVTIAYANGISSSMKKLLRAAEIQFGPRWQVLAHTSWYEHALQMGLHDLVVWPASTDGFGIVGSTALCMGTPVIAWNMPPISEYLTHGRNAILVDTPLEYDWLGVPRLPNAVNFAEFNRLLRWLIEKPSALAELRKHTSEHLYERRRHFNEGWNTIFPADV